MGVVNRAVDMSEGVPLLTEVVHMVLLADLTQLEDPQLLPGTDPGQCRMKRGRSHGPNRRDTVEAALQLSKVSIPTCQDLRGHTIHRRLVDGDHSSP